MRGILSTFVIHGALPFSPCFSPIACCHALGFFRASPSRGLYSQGLALRLVGLWLRLAFLLLHCLSPHPRVHHALLRCLLHGPLASRPLTRHAHHEGPLVSRPLTRHAHHEGPLASP